MLICCMQMALAVQHGRHSGNLVRYAAARVALWIYHDLPALMEALLFPNKVRVLSFSRHFCGNQIATLPKNIAYCALRSHSRASPMSPRCSVAGLMSL